MTLRAGPPTPTSAGALRGLVENGIHVFRGIPYGAPTGGTARFKPPRPADPWTGAREAISWGFEAPQGNYDGPPATLHNEIDLALHPGTLQRAQSEDCLYLNVWTPALDQGARPVMVWLHGGGFAGGSGARLATGGGNLAAQGAVVITVNHRLNTLGCTYLDDIGGEEFAGSGNVAMLDLVLALRWVKDNIDRFGGDPGNVTIFGFSGGGQKVSTLLAMPSAKGLFHRAIIQSGSTPLLLDRDQAADHTDRLFRRLGLAKGDIAGLQAAPVGKLVEAFRVISAEPPTQTWGLPARFSPVVDSRVIPHHPIHKDAIALHPDVPVMIGSMREEMSHWSLVWNPNLEAAGMEAIEAELAKYLSEDAAPVLAGYREIHPEMPPWDLFTLISADYPTRFNAIRIVERRLAEIPAPHFMYRVDWQTPVLNGRLKAPHGTEVAMIFRNVEEDAGVNGGGEEARALSEQMSAAWLAFARTGDPSTSTLPWPSYDIHRRPTMLFDRNSQVAEDPGGAERKLLQRLLRPISA